MARGPKMKINGKKPEAKIEDTNPIEDKDENASQSSVAAKKKKKKKKNSSEASTAASTSSTVRKSQNKKKAMEKADNVMSGLTGMTDSSHGQGKKKKEVQKKSNRKKSLLENNIGMDDGVSYVTETSKSTKGTKKKKKSSSKKIKHISSPRTKGGDEEKLKKKLSKLNKRDKHYHKSSKSKIPSLSRTPSLTYHSRGDSSDDDNNDDSDNDTRTSSRHSMASAASSTPSTKMITSSRHSMTSRRSSTSSSKSNTRLRSSKFGAGKEGSVGLKILPDGSIKPSVPRKSQSFDNDDVFFGHSNDDDSDSVSQSDSDSYDESSSGVDMLSRSTRSSRRSPVNRDDIRRTNSAGDVRKMALEYSQKIQNKRTPYNDRRSPPSATSSRGKRQPVRIADMGDSVEVRSLSSEHLGEMRIMLKKSSSHGSDDQTNSTPSSRNLPSRRGVSRNASAPLQNMLRRKSIDRSIEQKENSPSPSSRNEPPQRGINRNSSAPLQNMLRRKSSDTSIEQTKNTPSRRGVNRNSSAPLKFMMERKSSDGSIQETRNIHFAPSSREAPSRRGVNRNKSAPLRSAMRSTSQSSSNRNGSGGGLEQRRTPLRSTKSAFLQKTQRRPPSRTNSKSMSTDDHLEMLGSLRNDNNNNRRGRSSSQPPDRLERGRSSSQPPDKLNGATGDNRRGRRQSGTIPASRSLSPGRMRDRMVRDRSQRSGRNGSFVKTNSQNSFLSTGDIINSSDDDDDSFRCDVEDSGSEHDVLNDSRHIMGIDEANEPNRRDMSRSMSRGRSMSRTQSKRLRRSSSNGSLAGFSTHSFMSNRSQMSMDVEDVEYFEDDPYWKVPFRYIHLLPPYKNEPKLKKKIRIFTWIAMLLDFSGGVVSIVQYSSSTMCCGEPIFDAFFDFDWNGLFRIITIAYVLLIFAEIIPVIKNGIPFNIVNPTIGLLLMTGMFFDDSVGEAVTMWVVEVMAIFAEFLVYRIQARMFFEITFKLKQVDEELVALKEKQMKLLEMYGPLDGGSTHGGSMHGSRHGCSIHGGSMHGSINGGLRQGGSRHGSIHGGSRHGGYSRDNSRSYPTDDIEMGGRNPSRSPPVTSRMSYNDDDDSLSGHSFGDDENFFDESTPSGRCLEQSGMAKSTSPPHRIVCRTKSKAALEATSTHSYGASTAVTGITGGRVRVPLELKQNRLLRKRRILREDKIAEAKELRYHFIGTVLNVSLAVAAMILVVTISATGGLCFTTTTFVDIFSFDQFRECDRLTNCTGLDGCESCAATEDENDQCYYAYY